MKIIPFVFVIFICCACGVSRNSSYKKFPKQELRKDYSIFRNILEESHPGLYWYTPKDSMDMYFSAGEEMLRDSMNAAQFKNVLSYVLSHVRCGHTSARLPSRYSDSLRNRSFPLLIKFWEDTAVVVTTASPADIAFTRGSLVLSIDDRPVNTILDSLFKFMSADGYNTTHLYQGLSSRMGFSNLYFSVFGYKPKYKITYSDPAGNVLTRMATVFVPPRDTTKHPPPVVKLSKRERKKQQMQFNRKLTIDSSLNTALLDLNSFSKGNRLRSFFKTSFRSLRKNKVDNLIIDLRGNGGGRITNSNLLTKYISDHRFKIADSLYAVTRKSHYGNYMKGYFWNSLFMHIFTKKRSDGFYHFGFYERKYFKPKNKNHFNGTVYVLTGGNTFSASTLFARAVKPQQNVVVVGEETGGGDYGNNAWLIPDVTLPVTKVAFRLPMFRLVTDKNAVKGYGVQPEIFVGPSVDAIRKNLDYKMEAVRKLIAASRKK